jgi:hypothetical protein
LAPFPVRPIVTAGSGPTPKFRQVALRQVLAWMPSI